MASESEWKKFQEDPRVACKYGDECYQKNLNHLNKFKHPPNISEDDQQSGSLSPPAKKRKEEIPPEDDDEDVTIDTDSPHSTDEDPNDEIPESPTNLRDNLKQKFLVEFPQDFFDLWDLCSKINKNKPEDAFSTVGLKLCGPYDLLSIKKDSVKNKKLSSYLCHWRFYHDPPEFQTIIAGSKDGFHIGYFRDDPSSLPAFVASMTSKKAGHIKQLGENAFAALFHHLDNELKNCDVFKKCTIQKLIKEIEDYSKEKNYVLDVKTPKMKERNKMSVANSFHGAGIVVPVNKKTDVGYREIPETDANLRKILQKIVNSTTEENKERNYETLEELITNAQWATDEGDFGMGLELGMDLFIFGGKEFHSAILHLLTVAYDLLDRNPFGQIIKAHLKDRQKGTDMNRLF